MIGTKLEDELRQPGAHRKFKITEAGHIQKKKLFEQDVRDENGKKRLHGAFTGGFTAGYWGTVGSKEGWAPQAFVSSRSQRAQLNNQNQNRDAFMDNEDY